MSNADNDWGCLKWVAFLGIDGILLLLSLVGILFFSAFGPTVTLTCTRRNASDVFCSFNRRTFVLGGSMGGIGVVRGAVNDQKCNWSGCRSRVVLETTDGKRPLTDEYTPGSKADFVNRLNSFIADRSQTNIELTHGPNLSLLLPAGLAILGSLLLIWGYLESKSRRARRVTSDSQVP